MFYEIDTCGQFHKTFWHNLHCSRHIALSFYSGYAAWGINYTEKSFMKLTPGLLSPFWLKVFWLDRKDWLFCCSSKNCFFWSKKNKTVFFFFFNYTLANYYRATINSLVYYLWLRQGACPLNGVPKLRLVCLDFLYMSVNIYIHS
jgi:hypothetical protein